MAVVVTLTLTVTVQKQTMYVVVMINVYAPCQRSEPSRIHVWTVGIKIEFKKKTLNGSMSPRVTSIFKNLNIELHLPYFHEK